MARPIRMKTLSVLSHLRPQMSDRAAGGKNCVLLRVGEALLLAARAAEGYYHGLRPFQRFLRQRCLQVMPHGKARDFFKPYAVHKISVAAVALM